MRKINKISVMIIIMLVIIGFSKCVLASWKDYIGFPIKTYAYAEILQVQTELYEADVNAMSNEEKQDYKKLLDEFFENAEVKDNPETKFPYYAELLNRKNALAQNNTTPNTGTNTPRPSTAPTQTPRPSTGTNTPRPTPTPTSTPRPNGDSDQGEFIFGTEGVQDSWEELLARNVFNSTDLAMVAIYAESYIKDTDINTITAQNIDEYIRGLEMILNNTGLKTDSMYRPIYDMAQDRLARLATKNDITTAQRERIESLRERAIQGGEDNEGNATTPTPPPTSEVLENRVGTKPPDELASYSPNDKTSPDDIIDEGSDFLTTGKENQGNVTMNGEKVQTTSDLLFNLAFAAGIGIAAVIGTYLGIKFMLGGAEEKANIKESLLPYIMGVVIMFASFSIWKLVLVLLQAIDNI